MEVAIFYQRAISEKNHSQLHGTLSSVFLLNSPGSSDGDPVGSNQNGQSTEAEGAGFVDSHQERA